MAHPRLIWDVGTAYDFFLSLEVLHNPAYFGVRPAWTAGMRARLPADAREILEQGQLLFHIPAHWIYTLPQPKDAATVLWMLGQIPPAERLSALSLTPVYPPSDVAQMLKSVVERRTWKKSDEKLLRTVHRRFEHSENLLSPKEAVTVLEWWSRSEEFGERYLEGLRAYQDVFFAEEERQIQPALEEALSRAQKLAEKMLFVDLLEEISQGVRIPALETRATELVLAPSYWFTPLIHCEEINPRRWLFLFGARPPDVSLIPCEAGMPDLLLRRLKALSDPTRLRILQYLSEEPHTPAQLTRRLRLRAPTITHHLKILRLAGLVLVQITKTDDFEIKQYAARPEAVTTISASLTSFLGNGEPDISGHSV